jgi:DNA processing protein
LGALGQFAPVPDDLDDAPRGVDGRSSDPADELDAEYRGLLEAMGFDPVSVDLLVRRSGLTPQTVSSMLLILELRGQVTAAPGGIYTRVR